MHRRSCKRHFQLQVYKKTDTKEENTNAVISDATDTDDEVVIESEPDTEKAEEAVFI